ncbi:hypothetical protein Tco_1204615 [Tanacetum coccineum]
MVGSLMYLTASRPDLVFAVCMCARYQASPTKKHLEALKRVFRYLRGTINWGLWYPKDSAMALTAYADADHVDKMADENAPAPTRSDDQILPFAAWVPIGKSNFVLDLQKKQKNPIFQISVDILQNTNFFRAFTASASITPIDQAHQFVLPPLGDSIMDFVTKLGYIKIASPFHLAKEDLRLGNLKFVPKGEEDKVFGMPIPNELISNNIRNAPYYNAYLEMVAKHDRKVAAEQGGKKKPATAKQPKPKPAKEKSRKPAPAPKPKATPLQKADKGKVTKVRNVKSSFQLVDEPDEEPTQPEPEPKPETEYQGEGEEYDVERAIQMSLESFHAQGQAHVGGVAICEPVAEATRPLPVVEGKGKAIC